MRVHAVNTDPEKDELNRLLWEVLWRPLGLPPDIGQSFKLSGPQMELTALEGEVMIGGLVANWLSENRVEIRHIAVKPEFQDRKVGQRLVEELFLQIRRDYPVTVQAHARNTSLGLFLKLGFQTGSEIPAPPAFASHGITIYEVRLELAERPSLP